MIRRHFLIYCAVVDRGRVSTWLKHRWEVGGIFWLAGGLQTRGWYGVRRVFVCVCVRKGECSCLRPNPTYTPPSYQFTLLVPIVVSQCNLSSHYFSLKSWLVVKAPKHKNLMDTFFTFFLFFFFLTFTWAWVPARRYTPSWPYTRIYVSQWDRSWLGYKCCAAFKERC